MKPRAQPTWFLALLVAIASAGSGSKAPAQSVLSGRVLAERFAGSEEKFPFSTVLCFASPDGPGREPHSFRTWETEPAGWWRIDGAAGNYTLLFTQPARFFRPVVWNNIFVRPGEKVDRFHVSPRFDFACFAEKEWDAKAGTDYFQTFVAKGKSATSVGFRLVHDGVDGAGSKSQNLLVSIHRQRARTPDQWPQVGPTVPVLNVDSGGGKNYLWSAGWNSGEVPLVPGETYAVHLRAEIPGGVFQPFWRAGEDATADCYRIGATNTGWQKHALWMAVGTDGDGLLIPYNKRVQREFNQFAGSAHAWSQTYVAQGRGTRLGAALCRGERRAAAVVAPARDGAGAARRPARAGGGRGEDCHRERELHRGRVVGLFRRGVRAGRSATRSGPDVRD